MPTRFHSTFEERAQLANERAFGVAVTLQRGNDSTAEFTAVFDDQEYDSVELETGLPIKIQSRVWYIPAAALVIDDEEFSPASGQRIIEADTEAEYEIVPIAGRPAAELQPGDWRWRVHTQRVTSI